MSNDIDDSGEGHVVSAKPARETSSKKAGLVMCEALKELKAIS